MASKEVNVNQPSGFSDINVNVNGNDQSIDELSVFENIEAEHLNHDLLNQLYLKLNKNIASDFATIKEDFLRRNILWSDISSGKIFARLVAVLFAIKDPSSVLGQFAIELSVYESRTEKRHNSKSQRVCAPLPEAVEVINEFLYKYLRSAPIVVDFKRFTIYEIPIIALREAIINALVHKDYSSNNKVSIEIYRTGEIVIFNPGTLPDGITMSDIDNNDYRPAHRNPKIVDFLSQYVASEGKGEGILAMKNEMMDNGLEPPKIEEKHEGVQVTLKGPGDSFDPSQYKTPQNPNFEIGQSKIGGLSLRQKDIVNYLLEGNDDTFITNKLYQTRFKVSHDTAHADLADLKRRKVIFRHGKGRATKYLLRES